MSSISSLGLLWCFCFVALEAVQAVFFGAVFQRMDAFLVGTCVFGLSTAASLAWVRINYPAQLVAAFKHHRTLFGLNVTAAGGWLTYLLSIQLIEPAVSFALFSGAVPLTTLVAARFGVPEASPARNTLEAVGNAMVAIAMASLIVTTVLGLSGFVRGGVAIAITGATLAVLSGALITGMLFYGQRLHVLGVGPIAQFGLRFGIYLVLSLSATVLELDSKGPVSLSYLAYVVAIGLLIMAFPIYAVQKAVSLVPTLTIASVTALGPLFVFAFQIVEGRVTNSPATLLGLCIYFSGAVVGVVGSARFSAVERARSV